MWSLSSLSTARITIGYPIPGSIRAPVFGQQHAPFRHGALMMELAGRLKAKKEILSTPLDSSRMRQRYGDMEVPWTSSRFCQPGI
jgi:hypothetical protein